jgi:hypothetical protein
LAAEFDRATCTLLLANCNSREIAGLRTFAPFPLSVMRLRDFDHIGTSRAFSLPGQITQLSDRGAVHVSSDAFPMTTAKSYLVAAGFPPL